MPKITITTPGATPPRQSSRQSSRAATANPADEDLDPTDDRDEPHGLIDRTTDFLSGRYANRKARKRLAPPRGIAGRRG